MGGPLLNQALGLITAAPVRGGSGAFYSTIAAGIAGETALVTSGATVAGTTNGVIVGPAGWAAFNLVGRFAVLVDAVPGNAMAAVYARVIAQVGATLTIDSPLNFGVGLNVDVVEPAILTVNGNVTGNFSVSKALILNLGGCVSRGQADITAGAFVWIRDGEITDGMVDSRAVVGVLRLDSLSISSRGGTIYALLKTAAVNAGAVESYNVEFMGSVAGRQGICRWVIVNCVNQGRVDGTLNIPWGLVEADGAALTFTNVSVAISSRWGGAIFASINGGTLTSGAPNFFVIRAQIIPLVLDIQGSSPSPRPVSILLVRDTSTATVNVTTGNIFISCGIPNDTTATDAASAALDFALLRGRSLTGSGTLTLAMAAPVLIDLSGFGGLSGLVTVDGAANTTGTLTLNGAATRNINLGQGYCAVVLLRTALAGAAGAITVSAGIINVKGGQLFVGIYFVVNHTLNTPTVTISATMTVSDCSRVSMFSFGAGVANVSVGTWTISGAVNLMAVGNFGCSLATVVSGGTWTQSGNVFGTLVGDGSLPLDAASHFGTGGTLTVSGALAVNGGFHLSFRHCHARTNGGQTVTKSGISSIKGMEILNEFAFVFSETGGGAPSVAVGSGGIFCNDIWFDQSGSTAVNVVNAVGTATGPASFEAEYCFWTAAFNTQVGAGALTWAAGTIPFFLNHCEVDGAFSIVGTPFSFFEVFESTFYSAVSDSGTRPATRYAWYKCDFNRQFLSTTLRADILDDYFTINNDGIAKAQGQLCDIDATPQASDPAAASDTIEGVVFEAVGANNNAVILIRRGVTNVRVEPAVVIGDNLIARAAVDFTEAITGTSGTGVGRRIGRALTAHGGAGGAERAYAAVNLM